MKTIVSAHNLHKVFDDGHIAVNGVSFDIYEHEIVGLVGPNSSGKSTTQRMLATVLRPTSGTIAYGGMTVKTEADKEAVRKLIGYVPQGNCLYGDLTVLENLRLFSQPYRLNAVERDKRIQDLLERLNAWDRRHRLVRDLSGGMLRRISVIAALVHKPKFLLLDEVTMGLDPVSRMEIGQLIEDLRKETTIIMTTHYIDEIEKHCDRLIILAKGKVLENGKPQAITRKYGFNNVEDVMAHIIKRER